MFLEKQQGEFVQHEFSLLTLCIQNVFTLYDKSLATWHVIMIPGKHQLLFVCTGLSVLNLWWHLMRNIWHKMKCSILIRFGSTNSGVINWTLCKWKQFFIMHIFHHKSTWVKQVVGHLVQWGRRVGGSDDTKLLLLPWHKIMKNGCTHFITPYCRWKYKQLWNVLLIK